MRLRGEMGLAEPSLAIRTLNPPGLRRAHRSVYAVILLIRDDVISAWALWCVICEFLRCYISHFVSPVFNLPTAES